MNEQKSMNINGWKSMDMNGQKSMDINDKFDGYDRYTIEQIQDESGRFKDSIFKK